MITNLVPDLVPGTESNGAWHRKYGTANTNANNQISNNNNRRLHNFH